MGNFLVYFILVSLIVSGFMYPKSKIVHALLVFTAFSLYTMSYDEYDRLVYMSEYDNVDINIEARFEFLFVLLMRLCSKLGLTFESFRYVTALITIAGLEYASLKLSKYHNYIWAVYLIYPAMFDATLIRSSLAMSFIAIFLIRLIYAKNIRDYFICGILIIIASLIHSSSFIYIIFIPIWLYIKKSLTLFRFIILFVSFSAIASAGFSLIFYVVREIREQNEYYYSNLYHGNILYNTLMYLTYITPALLFRPSIVFKSKTNLSPLESNILAFNILFVFILIPQFYIANFSRLFKILIFFNYIYLSKCAEIPKWRPIAVSYMFIYSSYLLAIRLITSPNMLNIIVNMHFGTNDLLNIFKL